MLKFCVFKSNAGGGRPLSIDRLQSNQFLLVGFGLAAQRTGDPEVSGRDTGMTLSVYL